MLVRRRCVPLGPEAPTRSIDRPIDRRSWIEDVADGAYWGAADLVFEGP